MEQARMSDSNNIFPADSDRPWIKEQTLK